MECLINIVGITENVSNCPERLAWITESKSGLFLDDTSQGRIPLSGAFFTTEQIVEQLVPNAVNEAIQKLQLACERRLVKHYGTHTCTIGFSKDYTGSLNATDDYYYLVIKGKDIRGGLVQINKIVIHTLAGKHTGDVLIMQDGVEIYNGAIGSYTSKTLNIESDIYIAYKGSAPLNFKHKGCCGNYPQYQGYVYVGSGTAATTDDFVYVESEYSNGIELNVTFDCYPWAFLCNLDFKQSTFGVVFAKLVQQIARANVGYYIMTDDKISGYSQVREEELKIILEYLAADIKSMLDYLPENLSQTDCYICNGVYKNEILI